MSHIYQIKQKLRQHGIVAFSSNYALYGDMSERVMTLIESLVPAVEVYSIDEAFADLTGIEGLDALGRQILASAAAAGIRLASRTSLRPRLWPSWRITRRSACRPRPAAW